MALSEQSESKGSKGQDDRMVLHPQAEIGCLVSGSNRRFEA